MILKCNLLSFKFCNKLFCLRSLSTRNVISLKERGMLEDIFPDNSVNSIIDLLNAAPQCVYAGFDPTAKSLHVGNLLVLINLLHWHRGGHKAIALIGGATAKIGDPSGKSTERIGISPIDISENVIGIKQNIEQIFENHEKYFSAGTKISNAPIVLNNDSWYNNFQVVQFIGGVARHMRMGTMLSRKSVQSRLNSPAGMSFCEFSYQAFQAYDWLHLFKTYQCRFQIGGNDQMGNIMSGYELISRIYEHKEKVYGLTVPLITTEMGDKFGKSAGNAIWLSADKTSHFDFYQFWMRMSDSDAEKMLKLFTFDSLASIEDKVHAHSRKPENRILQKKLADTLTTLVHGEEGLRRALLVTEALYKKDASVINSLNADELKTIFEGAAVVKLLPEPGENVVDVSMRVGCFPTESDAVRIISAGGFYINQKRCNNPDEILNPSVHRLANNVTLFRVGKKNYYLIHWLV